MTFSELTQAIVRNDSGNITEFVQRNQSEIKLLFLNATEDDESQELISEAFIALLQRNYTDVVKSSDSFQGLVNHFALYFKRTNQIGHTDACRHLSIHPIFKSRIQAYILTKKYNDVAQHIIRFQEYLNIISQASDSEDSDFTSDIVDDIAEYYLFGKEQLERFGQVNRVQEFESLFENENYRIQYPILSPVLTKLFNRYFDLPVKNITNKIYEPSVFTNQLFETKFLQPIKTHPKTNWHQVLLGFPKNEIRYDIIATGQADFDRKYKSLSANEVVILYCYFNMRMHYYTSLSIFERLSNLIEIYKSGKRIKFIDIGCGPATSGIALIDFIHNHTGQPVLIDYFGVDIAQSMRDTAVDFLNNDVVDKNSLIRVVKDVDELDLEDLSGGSCILINTCYLFASPRLDIYKLANFVNEIRAKNKKVLTYLLFQNTNDRSKSENYFRFKELIEPFETAYSKEDKVFYNNKRNSSFEPTSEHVFYELLKL